MASRSKKPRDLIPWLWLIVGGLLAWSIVITLFGFIGLSPQAQLG